MQDAPYRPTGEGDCIPWRAWRSGYGSATLAPRYKVPAHRHVWEECFGPIPDGLVIDHLCRNPICVNPNHLEPVTHAENIRRGKRDTKPTHCPRGHAYTAENNYRVDIGRVACKICARDRAAAARARKRALRAHRTT
jgi:hypothetical protein